MQEYEIEIGGIIHTVQLSEEDAKRLNAKPVKPNKQAKPPENK